MIFSFGTTWRNEEQIVFLIRSIFRERRCCLWLYCLPGDRKCKVIEKKRKSAITSLWTFFCRVIWKPLTKRQMGWLRCPDIHHNEFGAYWYFQSILRLRGTETKQQAQNRFQGDFGIAFYRIFLPVLTIQCRICRWGGWVKIVGLWEESKFSSGLNSGSPSTCSHSDLGKLPNPFELHLWRDNNLYLAGLWWGWKNSNLPMFPGMVDSQVWGLFVSPWGNTKVEWELLGLISNGISCSQLPQFCVLVISP